MPSSGQGSRRGRSSNQDLDRVVRQSTYDAQDPLSNLDPATGERLPLTDVGPAYSVEGEFTSRGTLPRDERASARDVAAQNLNADLVSQLISGSQGQYPHFFREQKHQVFHLSAVVYIQGVDVSRWLTSDISIDYNLNSSPNTCSFTLDNSLNRFTLTPENFQGKWRMARDVEFSEWEKRQLYDFKSQLNVNPADSLSGGLRYPLEHYGSIFHIMDPVRVWIRNPASGYEADEWIPAFTGYVVSKPRTTDYVNPNSNIEIQCQDIRFLMRKMRINDNTVLAQLPGEALTGNASPFDSSFFGPANVQEDVGFFRDITVTSSKYENPWVNLNLPQLVQALTFAENAQDVIDAVNSPDRPGLEEQKREIEREIARIGPGGDPSELSQLQANLNAVNSRLEIYDSSITNRRSAQRAESPSGPSGTSVDSSQSIESIQLRQGRSRIGGMQRGFFPSASFSTRLPDSVDARRSFLRNWYSLLFFGTPVRNILDSDGRTGSLDYSTQNYRYWKLAEVRDAGRLTKSDFAWRPDAQLVHMIEPSSGSPGDPIFRDVSVLSSSLSTSRNFVDRLQIISDACDGIDYKFWVTGTGDIAFEFPQYDFNPADYGSWSDVLNVNFHMLNESFDNESTEITTVMVAVGSLTGISNIPNPQSVELFAPSKLAVGVWSPTLVSRHGVKVEIVSYPQISTEREGGLGRLRQLATLEFQKRLALADFFSVGIVYRPWLIPNKPLFFKRSARYGLIDNIRHVFPATVGLLHIGTPSTSISLIYSRGIDPFGIPRYITGGPSQAVYFGQRDNTSVYDQIANRATLISDAINRFNSGEVLTSDSFRELRDELGGFLPLGDDPYNIIGASFDVQQIASGQIEDNIQTVQQSIGAVQQSIRDILDNSGLTEADATRQLDSLNQLLISLVDRLQQFGVDGMPLQDSDVGTLPWHGQSGVRDTEYVPPDSRPLTVDEPTSVGGCELDSFRFSSPLGRTTGDITKNSVRNSESSGQVSSSGEFPRKILSWPEPSLNYGFPGNIGERIYSIADGVVNNIIPDSNVGNIVVIYHNDGFVSAYGNIQPEVSVGQDVLRNTPIGTLGSVSTDFGVPTLNFRLGRLVSGSSQTEVIGYIQGLNAAGKVPLTGDDALWIARAIIGEEYGLNRDGRPPAVLREPIRARAILTVYLQRLAFLNDSLARTNRPLWGLTRLVRAHSQPVNPIWADRGDEAQRRRRAIYPNLQWEDMPDGLRDLVIGTLRGEETLITSPSGIIDFADDATTQRALARRAASDEWQRFQILPAQNWFMSRASSRQWATRENYLVISPSSDQSGVISWYNPINLPSDELPGVPNTIWPSGPTARPIPDKVVVLGDSYAEQSGFTDRIYRRIADAFGIQDITLAGERSTGLMTSRGDKSWNMDPLKSSIRDRVAGAQTVFVHLGNNDGSHRPDDIETFNSNILSAGVQRVIWLPPTYRPQGRPDNGRRALSMRRALNSANVESASGLNETPNSDLRNDQVHLRSDNGSGDRWADRVIGSLRPFFSSSNVGSTTTQEAFDRNTQSPWDGAVPPEECPPDAQARFNQPRRVSPYEPRD